MKNSEPIFEEYLKHEKFNFMYEETINGVRPDFSVWQDGSPSAFWDFADRKLTASDRAEIAELVRKAEAGEGPTITAGPSKDYYFLIDKMNKKYRQFSKCAPIPGMLVLAEWAGQVNESPEMVAAALYGWPQMRITLGSSAEKTFCRADDGRAGTCFAAVAFIRLENVNRYHFGLESFSKEAVELFPNDFPHALRLIETEESRLRSLGIDLDCQRPVLNIFLNSRAASQWPLNLVGEYDRVYRYNEATLQFELDHDGLAARTQNEIPASQTQADIWALMDDPKLRNEPQEP